MTRALRSIVLGLGLLALGNASSRAADSPDTTAPGAPAADFDGSRSHGLEPLVPELAAHPYALDPGPREFLHRISISPAYGMLGSNRIFALRAAYNPNSWLGYEAALGHDPGQSVHAVLHTLSAIVRHPVSGRLQPYLSAGYGMMIVFPGLATNAASVTKNALVGGGGLELYIRNDLALRADAREASVFGQQRGHEGIVAYNYFQGTIGLAFYRTIRP